MLVFSSQMSSLLLTIFSKMKFFLADVLFQRDMKLQSFTHMTAFMKLRTYCLLVLTLACYGGRCRWEVSCTLVNYTAKFYFSRIYAVCINIVRECEK